MHISGVVTYCKEDHSKSFIRVCLVLHNAKARQRYPKIENWEFTSPPRGGMHFYS